MSFCVKRAAGRDEGMKGATTQTFLHVQALLGLRSFVLGAVADHGVTVRKVEVECDQRAVLHTQSPQGGAVDLWTDSGLHAGTGRHSPACVCVCACACRPEV